ncbi:MAG: agmatinase [Epibacterium sp.]|nr:agmatinase [Epibacterium sp.]NQX74096.1 agmatinase [Epibacterium sp.]
MKELNQPISGDDLARFSGPTTFMRLPLAHALDGLDVAIVGVPMDIGTSWRSGARFAPKEIRNQSAAIRPYNLTTGDAPFEVHNIADIGDLAINTYSLPDTLRIVEESFDAILTGSDVVPVALGGDQSITLPILRAMARKHGPMAVVHVDARSDSSDETFGERNTSGTVFRRAQDEGLVDSEKVYQIGLRGTGETPSELKTPQSWGFQHFLASELWNRSMAGLGTEIRRDIGGRPVYLSFDISALDPGFAPGTGAPEIGGLTSMQALELVRALKGVNLVGCDMVEVAPAYDPTGTTSLVAAHLVYEMLCMLPQRSETVE